MSLIDKLKKDELKLVAEELKLTKPEGANVLDLKNLIENSDVYKTDRDFVKSVMEYVIKEIKTKKLEMEIQLQLEKIQLAKREKPVELANIRKDLNNASVSTEFAGGVY